MAAHTHLRLLAVCPTPCLINYACNTQCMMILFACKPAGQIQWSWQLEVGKLLEEK
jgi:hypothetical protein